MSDPDYDALELFIAGVPPRILFDLDIDELSALIKSCKKLKGDEETHLNKVYEVCLISLACYFEAFCKNQFAAIINICPQALNNFTARRDNVNVKLKHLIRLEGRVDHRLGSLLAEECDFGSARTINSLYLDLLGITPFSKNEEEQYNEFLNDRNLLVHHGGVYTIKYHEQRFQKQPIKGSFHWDSLIIEEKDFNKWLSFIGGIVDKIAKASHKALEEYIKKGNIELSRTKREALKYLLLET